MTVRFVLVRHGESEWNLAGRWQGHGGSGLTPLGRRQAEAAAAEVAGRYPEAAVVARSDLQRVVETAAPLEARLGAPVVVDRRLRELDVGSWSGRTHEEIMAADPEGFAAWRRGEDVRFGGGERQRDLVRRVASALGDLRRRLSAGGGTAVVVAHGGTIRAAAAALLGVEDGNWQHLGGVGNGSVTEFVVDGADGARARLVAWAHVDHLPGDLDDRLHAEATGPR